MHRRQFISLIIAGIVTPAFSMPLPAAPLPAAPLPAAPGIGNSEPATPVTHVLFLGLGGAGGNFIDHLAEALRASPSPPATTPQRAFPYPQRPYMAAKQDRQAVPEFVAQEGKDPGNFDRIIVLAGLGGHAGGDMIVKCVESCLQQSVPVAAVVSLPFGFEGPNRRLPADAQLAALRASGCPLAVLHNDDLLTALAPRTSMRAALRHGSRLAAGHAMAAAWPA